MSVTLYDSLYIVHNDADRLVLCSQEPTSFEEVEEFIVGEKQFDRGEAVDAPYDTDAGTAVMTEEVTEGELLSNDTATHWALVDSTLSPGRLLAAGGLGEEVHVTRGRTWSMAPFEIVDQSPQVAHGVQLEVASTAELRVRYRIPPRLRVQLDAKATTHCTCWRLERTDGVVMGFTDHDEDVTFGGVTYEALSGIMASSYEQTAALDVDTVDIHGALQSDKLSEDQLAAGLFDNASLELWRVDWATPRNPRARHLLMAGSIGEVTRTRTTFKAEMRSLSHHLNQERGRVYSKLCDADLGDSRCTVDLTTPEFRGDGAVQTVIGDGLFDVTGINSFEDQWFEGGLLTFVTGQNSGISIEVRQHTKQATGVILELYEPTPFTVAAGDVFFVTAGCDKTVEMCEEKFDNVVNHRGFPFIPGNDVLMRFGSPDDNNDGGAILGGD